MKAFSPSRGLVARNEYTSDDSKSWFEILTHHFPTAVLPALDSINEANMAWKRLCATFPARGDRDDIVSVIRRIHEEAAEKTEGAGRLSQEEASVNRHVESQWPMRGILKNESAQQTRTKRKRRIIESDTESDEESASKLASTKSSMDPANNTEVELVFVKTQRAPACPNPRTPLHEDHDEEADESTAPLVRAGDVTRSRPNAKFEVPIGCKRIMVYEF